MIFRYVIVMLGFLTALSSFYFLGSSDPILSDRYVFARVTFAGALGLGSIFMVWTGVENRRTSASSTLGVALLMIGIVWLSGGVDEAISSDSSELSTQTLLVVGALLFGGIACLYCSRRKQKASEADVPNTASTREEVAATWLRFAPVTALAVGFVFVLLLSGALFLIGDVADNVVFEGLVGSVIFLICGAALAGGNRLSAMLLVKITAVGAVLSLATEQSLKSAPYRLLFAFILIKGALALRTSHNSARAIPRPRAAWVWMWALLIVFGIISVIGLIRLSDHLIFASRINHELAIIKRTGEPITLDDLARTYPEVPPHENAAVVMRPTLAALLLPKSDPTRVLRVAGPDVSSARNWSPEIIDQVSNYLAENAGILTELHRAGAMPKCHYEIDLNKGYEMQMRHLAALKKAAQLLQLEAIAQARDGHLEASARAVLTILKLANTLAAEPISISQLVRFNMQQIACVATEHILNIQVFDDAQLSSLFSAFRTAEDPMALKRALVADRCMGIRVFSRSMSDLMSVFQDQDETKRQAVIGGLWVMRVNGRIDRDYLNFLRMMRRYVSAADQPFPLRNGAAVELAEEVRAAKIVTNVFRVNVISGMLLPAMEKMFYRSGRNIAELRCIQTVVAIQRFSLVHHRLPTLLSDVLPYGLERIPLDPFDGGSLRYQVSETGYCVYSVGPDGLDDHGKPPLPGQANLPVGVARYDLPFSVNRPHESK